MPAEGPAKCFGYVQTYDTKPKRRLFEVLSSQNMQANQAVTFITDGGEDIRDLPLYLNPNSEHLLDWFHVTMRITVMANMAKSLRSPPPDPDFPSSPPVDLAASVGEELKRLKWFLWHENAFRALQVIGDLVVDLDVEDPGSEQAQAPEGRHRVRHLYPGQRFLHPQLRGTPPSGRDHLQLVRGVGRQPGREQTDREETADALESPRSTPLAPGAYPSSERRPGQGLPPVVSRVHPHDPRSRAVGGGCVALPRFVPVSLGPLVHNQLDPRSVPSEHLPMVAGVNSPCTLPKLKVLHCTDQTLDHVASIINGQRRRSLRYQSPAALYAAVR